MTNEPYRVVVLSDLHANARALKACLQRARAAGFDELVVLGDLLTYGADVHAVVDQVAELCSTGGATLLVGNHDWLYRDLPKGNRYYYDTLPGWLRESVDWTLRQLDTAAFEALPWQEEVVIGPILFSHANPFGSRNFRYLNQPKDVVDAAIAMSGLPILGGCFGHTHRSRLQTVDLTLQEIVDQPEHGCVWPLESEGVRFVANPGSVGQPRSADRSPSFLTFTKERTEVRAAVERVTYDMTAHVAAVQGMDVTSETREKLIGFFADANRSTAQT